jgi:hypothetical protein
VPVPKTSPVTADRDFYGAIIREATVGPRQELVLRIETWPHPRQTFGDGDVVTLRFGAIANYEEVKQFFAAVPTDSLHYLRLSSKSTPRRHAIEMEFDRSEARITIIAGNVSPLRNIKSSWLTSN